MSRVYKSRVKIHVTHKSVMSHMNESCHAQMSHVSHEWVMSLSNESCHARMSHVIHKWVMTQMHESCHTWMSHITHKWVMSHMNESCLSVMSHVTHEWVMSFINESWHRCTSHVTHEWVMSYTNEACHVYTKSNLPCVRVCVAVCCSVLQCVAVCDMTPSYVYKRHFKHVRHTWMKDAAHTCHTYIRTSRWVVCLVYAWVMSHTTTHCNTLQRTTDISYMNVSCQVYEWVVP